MTDGVGATGVSDERVRRAIRAVAAGRPVVVVDDADREDEGDLVFAAERATPQVRRLARTALPTAHGPFQAVGRRGLYDRGVHVTLVAGRVGGALGVPVSVYRECLTAEVLGSVLCRCGAALDPALALIAAVGRGSSSTYGRLAGPTPVGSSNAPG